MYRVNRTSIKARHMPSLLVQDFLFETGVDGDLHFQFGQQLAAFFYTTFGGFA
jgi:hypothetical protein